MQYKLCEAESAQVAQNMMSSLAKMGWQVIPGLFFQSGYIFFIMQREEENK